MRSTFTHATISSKRALMTAANSVRHVDEEDAARRRARRDLGVEAADHSEPVVAGEQANERRRQDRRDGVIGLPQRVGDRAPG